LKFEIEEEPHKEIMYLKGKLIQIGDIIKDYFYNLLKVR